jgi:hypothetical protein
MIEKYYASHIKDQLDTLAINVFRPKKKPKKTAGDPGSSPETPTQPAP